MNAKRILQATFGVLAISGIVLLLGCGEETGSITQPDAQASSFTAPPNDGNANVGMQGNGMMGMGGMMSGNVQTNMPDSRRPFTPLRAGSEPVEGMTPGDGKTPMGGQGMGVMKHMGDMMEDMDAHMKDIDPEMREACQDAMRDGGQPDMGDANDMGNPNGMDPDAGQQEQDANKHREHHPEAGKPAQ